MARKPKNGAAPASVGHNSNLNSDEKLKLSGFVSEIERWEAQKREISSDISEIYVSAKDAGFDVKALRHMIKMRRMKADERATFETAVDAYTHAMGDFATTELGRAAMPQQPNA